MRLTYHSSGSGVKTGGKHNDRSFNLDKASHIDATKTNKNLYIVRSLIEDEQNKYIIYNENKKNQFTFDEREQLFYEYEFKNYIDQRNASARKNGHLERCINADKMRHTRRYEPREIIIEIGNRNQSVDSKTLADVFSEFLKWHDEKFGSNIKTLNAAFHFDEATPHVHWRRVFEYTDKNGNKQPSMEQALRQLGYQRPDLNRPEGKYNNRQMVYTKDCRNKLIALCQERSIELELEPKKRTPNQQNLSKGEFLIQQQDEEIERQKIEYTELEEKQTALQKNIHNIEDALNQQQNEYNRLMEESQRLNVENNVNEEKLKQYKDKLLQVAFYEKNKSKIEVINKSFTEKIEMKTFFNSDKVKVEKSELMPLLALSKEIEERIKNIEEREKQLNLKENSINKQAENIIQNAKHQAKNIIQNTSEQSLSLNEKVKLAKYEKLIGDNELTKREREQKQQQRSKKQIRNVDIDERER